MEVDTGILGPRAAEVDRAGGCSRARASCDRALVDNIVRGVSGRGTAVSGDCSTASRDSDIGAVDPDYGVLAEDKVNGSFDVALSVNLVSGLGKKSVLVSVQTDAIVSLFGIVRSQCDGLGSLSVCVFDVDVVELGVCSLVDHGAGGFVTRSTAKQ